MVEMMMSDIMESDITSLNHDSLDLAYGTKLLVVLPSAFVFCSSDLNTVIYFFKNLSFLPPWLHRDAI